MKINISWLPFAQNIFSNNLLYLFLILFFLLILYISLRRSNNKINKKLKDLTSELKKEIQTSVQSKFIQLSPEAEVLIQIAIDNWRLNKKIVDISKNLSEKEKQSLTFSLDRISKHIAKFDIQVKDYTNEKYYEGLNVDVISVEKHKHSSKESIIKETIEPGVTIKGLLVKKAKVIIFGE
jgi:preprotein translocase subunit YajC